MPIKSINIPKSIWGILSLAIILNIVRIFLFETNSFVYMFWNIFLAFIPLLISSILLFYSNKNNIFKPLFLFGFILWFIFLPNAPYVITDFIHLGKIRAVPVMYDIFVLFSSALVSLMAGIFSMFHIEKILLIKFSKKNTNIILVIITLFASFGMYLGRFLRFNSWDFFVSHNFLISNIWDIFIHPIDNINAYIYTILFFVFIYTSYFTFKNINFK